MSRCRHESFLAIPAPCQLGNGEHILTVRGFGPHAHIFCLLCGADEDELVEERFAKIVRIAEQEARDRGPFGIN